MTDQQSRPRVGVIGVQDGWSSGRLADAFAQRTGERLLIELAHTSLDLESGTVRYGDLDLSTFDALVIKKLGHRYAPELLDRLEVLHWLHERGVRVFSRPQSLMRLLDRLSCTVMLRLADIPMPPTVITEDVDLAVEAVRRFGKAVLKPLYTSKARGMRVVEANGESRAQIEEFRSAGNVTMYIQQMLDLPGHDLGVVFLGGEYLGCYSRVAHDKSWHTSSSKGGKYGKYAPSDEIIELARRAQAQFELDFTCVDVAEGPDGPRVFEVSAFGGFRGLLEANGIDAAQRYADHVIRKIGHGA